MKSSGDVNDIMENEPPEFYLATLNRRIREMMDKALRSHGLKLVEWRLLHSLGVESPLTIHDLSRLSVIDRTVTSRLVEKLSESGLIKKITLAHDKRFLQVSLTVKGKNLLAQTTSDVNSARTQLFSHLNHTQVQALNGTLRTMIENADDMGNTGRIRGEKPR